MARSFASDSFATSPFKLEWVSTLSSIWVDGYQQACKDNKIELELEDYDVPEFTRNITLKEIWLDGYITAEKIAQELDEASFEANYGDEEDETF